MMHPANPIEYRSDINGLRAYAVMAVLLFHFKIPGFAAGFIGVDVFFVISGFLMTGIIVKGLEKIRLSVLQFYMARVRRIVPALLALLASLLVLGYFFLLTLDYKALGTQSISAMAFLSNVYFWRTAGYFDAAAHEKWLLHTWTLGVEAQFYVLLPLYLLSLWKLRPGIRTLFYGLIFAFIASLGLGIIASSWQPVAAFYLLPARGWEFLGGGLVFLLGRDAPRLKQYAPHMFWLGFALWLAAMLLIDGQTAWPSGWALLPVLGTMLIILAQQSDSVLTAHPVAQWLGDRSYSIYLWHWPVMVALYFAGLQDHWPWIVVGLCFSLLLGHLSFRWVETPSRIALSSGTMTKQLVALASAVMVVGAAAASARLLDVDGRRAPEIELAAAEQENKDPRRKGCEGKTTGAPDCIYGQGPLAAILRGDSHVFAIVTALEQAAVNNHKSVVPWSMSACPAMDGIRFSDTKTRAADACDIFNKWADGEMLKHPGVPIILVSRTSFYVMGPNEPDRQEEAKYAPVYFEKKYKFQNESGFAEEYAGVLVATACRIAKDRPVYLMRPIPEFGIDVPKTVSRGLMLGGGSGDIKLPVGEYMRRNKIVWDAQDAAEKQCGVKILDPLPYLCDANYCYGSKNGRPLYHDDDHLSEYGNKFLIPMFERIFMDQAG